MSKPTEPFVHPIRVGWGDCDPALIAYTGRIPNWALEAIDAWWACFAGVDWFQMNVDRGYGTPFVHMSLDFTAPITPRHRLDCRVELLGLGETSVRHRVVGRQNGVDCFNGNFVSVFVDSKTFTSRRPPEALRALVQGLQIT